MRGTRWRSKIILSLCGVVLMSCAEQPEEYALLVTDEGQIVLRFFPEIAPKHVESFKILAREGYFNGTRFHRVISDFMIQAGDPNTKDRDRGNDGRGGRAGKYYGIGDRDNPETWLLPAEFSSKSHKRGILSMARSPTGHDTAGSQFFICLVDVTRLDGEYTVFGEVVKGMDAVDRIGDTWTPRKRNPQYNRPDKDNPIFDIYMDVTIGTSEELGLALPAG